MTGREGKEEGREGGREGLVRDIDERKVPSPSFTLFLSLFPPLLHYMCLCVRARVCECECVCVCVRGGGGGCSLFLSQYVCVS